MTNFLGHEQLDAAVWLLQRGWVDLDAMSVRAWLIDIGPIAPLAYVVVYALQVIVARQRRRAHPRRRSFCAVVSGQDGGLATALAIGILLNEDDGKMTAKMTER